MVEDNFKNELRRRQIAYNTITTIPIGVGGMQWYGIARNTDSLYLARLSLLSEELKAMDVFPIQEELLHILPPKINNDMRWFAKNNYIVTKEGASIRIYNLQVDMRGVINEGSDKYPTAGYFTFTPNEDGTMEFSSGSHQVTSNSDIQK